MKSIGARYMVLLTCALLTSVEAGAAARGPSAREKAANKATRPATTKPETSQQALESWLSRLKGRFTLTVNLEEKTVCRNLQPNNPNSLQSCTITQQRASFIGGMQCDGIDTGPDLHCTFDELRPGATGNPGVAPVTSATAMSITGLPAQAVFGIDPAGGKLNVMTPRQGIFGMEGTGSLQDNAVTFKDSCSVASSTAACNWSFYIKADADGRRVVMMRTIGGNTHTFVLSRAD